MLSEAYPREDWSEGRVKLWTGLLGELPRSSGEEAVLDWVRSSRWPPTFADIRERAGQVTAAVAERRRMELADAERRQIGAGPPAGEVPTERLHLWRAALGQPLPGCGCATCVEGRNVAKGANE